MIKLLFCFLFLCCYQLSAQAIKGHILDNKGAPLPFSKIWISNSTRGTISNAKGEYHLEITKKGNFNLTITSTGYKRIDTTIQVNQEVEQLTINMQSAVLNLQEVVVTAENKKSKGKALMKKVIEKRSDFLESASRFGCQTYSFSTLDKMPYYNFDTVTNFDDPKLYTKEKMNISEWVSTSYFEANNRYKDVFTATSDFVQTFNNKGGVSLSMTVSGDEESIGLAEFGVSNNPYLIVNSFEDADINIFRNQIDKHKISTKPITSPLAFNALLNYNFYLEQSFFENGEQIFEVRVEPIFKSEALFYGTMYIRDKSFEPVSYELGINPASLNYFKEIRLLCTYKNIDGHIVPAEREFIYHIKEGLENIHGKTLMQFDDYFFEYDDSQKRFWLETQSYDDGAHDKDRIYWDQKRPFHLKQSEMEFIEKEDSVHQYRQSEEYLRMQDSSYNALSIWDFLVSGVGFRNSYKKQTIRFNPLIGQVVPFGTGGYRHRLKISYSKEFESGKALTLIPQADYGFLNKDLKGEISGKFKYNPRKLSEISFEVGDSYDLINSYESIQGIIAPANRVRNQKVRLGHRQEIMNGLYLGLKGTYSIRRDIGDIEQPDWTSIFGTFQSATPFETYPIFVSELELAYRFKQRYIIRDNRKIILENKWPLIWVNYRKGYPNIFSAESDFDFLEFNFNDELNFKSFGESEIKMSWGSFLRKNDLKIIEHHYFRTSDKIFFSDPSRSLQRLDTSLNTSNTYLQGFFIHHFNGFFLNKIPLLNKLKLEETIGGGLLMIPDANFRQVEFYVGLERQLRIKKQIFKIGFYAVAVENTIDKAQIRYKVGINFYDAFSGKWNY